MPQEKQKNTPKLKTIFSPRRVLIWLSILGLIVSFHYTNQPSQSKTQAVVSVLVADVNEHDNIEVSAIVVTPIVNSSSKHFAYTGEGATIAKAVQNVSLQLGKEMGFGQCDVMALGNKLCETNTLKVMDYLTRTKKVGKNSILLNFEGKTDEFANSIVYMLDNMGLSLSSIIDYNQKNTMASETNVETFLKNFYGDTGLSRMPKLSVQKEPKANAIKIDLGRNATSAGVSNDQEDLSVNENTSSSGSGEENSVYFINSGTTSIFKDGKKILEYTPKDMAYFNLLDKISKNGEFQLSNVNSDIYNNATLVIRLTDKKVKVKYKFEDEKPYVKYDLDLYIDIEEVVEDGKNKNLLMSENWFVDDAVVSGLTKLIDDNLHESMKKTAENHTDILNLYQPFNKFHNKKWKKYIECKENYLEGIKFDFNIKIYSDY